MATVTVTVMATDMVPGTGNSSARHQIIHHQAIPTKIFVPEQAPPVVVVNLCLEQCSVSARFE